MAGESRRRAQKLRDQGMTYKQIAQEMGVSKSYIGQLLGGYDPYHFQYISKEGCIYPGLRKWMNDNKVCRTELVRRMGKNAWSYSVSAMTSMMMGRTMPTKYSIDAILRVTGMTYEQCFGGVGNGTT